MPDRQTVRSRHYALHQYRDGRLEIEALSTGETLPVPPNELDLIMCDTYIESIHADANGLNVEPPDFPEPPWEGR